ncbi:glycolate oxidase subunit GlcE [Crenothrix sp.]|uniref:glycolate oxidase subunit GlcE n=1 Tax=Crenothrix sp. TaxID=3100433 RepID=UPI00374CC67E
MIEQDLSLSLQAQVLQAIANATPLNIIGGNSKAFYGSPSTATERLELGGHTGIIAYEPSELVITARSGTPLHAVETLLTEHGQMLAFEPPHFSPHATLGGTIACGFSGPRRPFTGSVRDFMLGCRIINGHGQVLRFGGQVIKNVAGFDVSRLMVGALGQLGVLLDVSLRVLPKPEAEITLCYPATGAQSALDLMQRWQNQPWPLSALCFIDDAIRVRLSGAEAAIQAAAQKLGGEIDSQGTHFWQALREQQLPFFQGAQSLWRISQPPATPPLDLSGDWLLDWGGAQRWLKSSEPAARIHAIAQENLGHAVCFRGYDKTDWLRLEPGLVALHQKIRYAFDPYGLFNPLP